MSRITMSETEIKSFQPLKEFWNYFQSISASLDICWKILMRRNNFSHSQRVADSRDNDAAAASIRPSLSSIFLYWKCSCAHFSSEL